MTLHPWLWTECREKAAGALAARGAHTSRQGTSGRMRHPPMTAREKPQRNADCAYLCATRSATAGHLLNIRQCLKSDALERSPFGDKLRQEFFGLF
jgi:hypothetical protein